MKIRAGYEISYDCPQPTPMILTLSVHPSRFPDLLTPDRMRLDPPIPTNTYHDSSGNFCHVIVNRRRTLAQERRAILARLACDGMRV